MHIKHGKNMSKHQKWLLLCCEIKADFLPLYISNLKQKQKQKNKKPPNFKEVLN